MYVAGGSSKAKAESSQELQRRQERERQVDGFRVDSDSEALPKSALHSMFLPESLGSSFLSGFWLDAAKKISTVQVMQDQDKLQKIKEQKELTAKIAVLTTPQFWTYIGGQEKKWHAVEVGNDKDEKKNDIGYCIGSDCNLTHCKICNKNDFVSGSLSVIDNTLGEKKKESTEQNEREDKKEELGNGAQGKMNGTGVRRILTRM